MFAFDVYCTKFLFASPFDMCIGLSVADNISQSRLLGGGVKSAPHILVMRSLRNLGATSTVARVFNGRVFNGPPKKQAPSRPLRTWRRSSSKKLRGVSTFERLKRKNEAAGGVFLPVLVARPGISTPSPRTPTTSPARTACPS